MKLTVTYINGTTLVFIGSRRHIENLIRELRNNKDIYYGYIVEKI